MPSSSMILCTEKNKRWNSNPHARTTFQNWKDKKQGIYFVWPKTEELLNNFSLEQPKLVIFCKVKKIRNKISVGNRFLMFFIKFYRNFGEGGWAPNLWNFKEFDQNQASEKMKNIDIIYQQRVGRFWFCRKSLKENF